MLTYADLKISEDASEEENSIENMTQGFVYQREKNKQRSNNISDVCSKPNKRQPIFMADMNRI